MNPIIGAFTLALTLALGVGPGLVLQIDAGLNRGFKGGVFLVLGLHLCDLFILLIVNLILFPSSQAAHNKYFRYFRRFGAVWIWIAFVLQKNESSRRIAKFEHIGTCKEPFFPFY